MTGAASTPSGTPGAEGHTAGPWTRGSVKNGRGWRDELMVYGPDGEIIANFESPRQPNNPERFIRTSAEDLANATLGARAPDLERRVSALVAALAQHVGKSGHTAGCTQLAVYGCSKRCQDTRAALAAAPRGTETGGHL